MAYQQKNAAGESFNMIQFHIQMQHLALNSLVRHSWPCSDLPRAVAGRAEPCDKKTDVFIASFYHFYYYPDELHVSRARFHLALLSRVLSPLNAQAGFVIQLYLLSVPHLDQNLSCKYPFARWNRFLIPLPSFHAIHFSLDHLASKDSRAECVGCDIYQDSSFILVSVCRAR